MQPTIGRIVYFYAVHPEGGVRPHAALVIDVKEGDPDERVNLQVFYPNGGMMPALNVPRKAPGQIGCWDWMPYQKGQAAKTEELEMRLNDAQAES